MTCLSWRSDIVIRNLIAAVFFRFLQLCSVNPKWSIVKGFRLIRFSLLNKILQMSNFKFFVSQDNFSRIAQIFLKFAMQMLSITEKFKNWIWNLAPLLVRWHTPSWKIDTSLVHCHVGTWALMIRMVRDLANSVW